MLKKNLVSFEPTTFSEKLTLYLPKTNSHSNRFFFELHTTKKNMITCYQVFYSLTFLVPRKI